MPAVTNDSCPRFFLDSPNTLILPAPAKLNLFLHVVGRRPDGYHLLESLFTLISLQDQIKLRRLEESVITLETPLPGVPAECDLTVRAATLLQQRTGSRLGVQIALRKRIPIGAGLGGGSSDAASVLLGLNQLWELDLPLSELAKLGLQLGADVPFFLGRRAAFVQGIGEILTPMSLPLQWFVLIQPSIAIATADVFNDPHLTRTTKPAKMSAFLEGYGANDLENVVLAHYSEARVIVEAAKSINWRARMTGSGSCFYIPVGMHQTAEKVAKQLAEVLTADYRIYVVSSLVHA